MSATPERTDPIVRLTSATAHEESTRVSVPMQSDRLGLVSALLGGVALLLAVVFVFQTNANTDLKALAMQGQAEVTKTQTLTTLDNNLVQLLAKAAAENNDSDIRALLARNGVTFRASPGPAAKAGVTQ